MKQFLCVLVALSFATSGVLASAETIAWDELVDKEAKVFEDPYLDLTYDQIDDLRTVAVETARIENGELSNEQLVASEEKLEQAGARLAEAGLDPEWLIAQRWIVAEKRERAAITGNPALDGQDVTLGGFAIPAPVEEDGTRIVYLVPERGMCSHMPPPNPNQMIRARISIDWEPQMMHEPVRLSGVLTVEETEHTFNIVDGPVPMRASFVMEVSQVETMADLMGTQTPPINSEWAQKIAEKLQAAQESTDDKEVTE